MRARRDLDQIFDYLDQTSGGRLAAGFVRKLNQYIARIARIGGKGAPRDRISPGLKLAIYQPYNIYFRVDETQMTVVRVLHSARDVRRLTFD